MALKKMWLDCDPGHDDALAILLACTHPEIQLLGLSTVACNQTVEKTTENAKAVLAAAGYCHIPVHQGQHKPLLRDAPLCPEIHGDTGLDAPGGGALFPAATQPTAEGRAVLAIAHAVSTAFQADGEKVHLVCTGALTNAALLLTLFPETAGQLQITVMGGALGVGNTGPVQEFNIQTDPEAAKIVFTSGVPVTMVPIEVTHKVLATAAIVERIAAMDSHFTRRIVQLLAFFASTYSAVFKMHDPPVHDPVAVAYVIQPGIFTTELMRVDVEVGSTLCSGQTVCDVWHMHRGTKNVNVALSLDAPACWQLILDAVAAADRTSPLNPESAVQ